jgi:hypothetical protein
VSVSKEIDVLTERMLTTLSVFRALFGGEQGWREATRVHRALVMGRMRKLRQANPLAAVMGLALEMDRDGMSPTLLLCVAAEMAIEQGLAEREGGDA